MWTFIKPTDLDTSRKSSDAHGDSDGVDGIPAIPGNHSGSMGANSSQEDKIIAPQLNWEHVSNGELAFLFSLTRTPLPVRGWGLLWLRRGERRQVLRKTANCCNRRKASFTVWRHLTKTENTCWNRADTARSLLLGRHQDTSKISEGRISSSSLSYTGAPGHQDDWKRKGPGRVTKKCVIYLLI